MVLVRGLLTLLCAAKNSAGELEKTKSLLRIPQRPRLCLPQPLRGRTVETRRVDSFKPAPTDHMSLSGIEHGVFRHIKLK